MTTTSLLKHTRFPVSNKLCIIIPHIMARKWHYCKDDDGKDISMAIPLIDQVITTITGNVSGDAESNLLVCIKIFINCANL